jgi:hypothetical protein
MPWPRGKAILRLKVLRLDHALNMSAPGTLNWASTASGDVKRMSHQLRRKGRILCIIVEPKSAGSPVVQGFRGTCSYWTNGSNRAHNPKVAGSNPAPAIEADKARQPVRAPQTGRPRPEGHREVAFVVVGKPHSRALSDGYQGIADVHR